MAEGYKAESIKVLEGLEAVRKRPAMYIGSTGKEGLHHLVWEAVDNAVDEALAGYCTVIHVTINKDGSVTVEDDGRGIPVDVHPQFKVSALQLIMTKLHAGGKFDKKTYAISGGLHGVGITCVNALSKKLIAEVKRDGGLYMQEYARGEPKAAVKKIKDVGKDDHGTKIIFWPDDEIFSTVKFDFQILENRFREIAFLNAGLKIILHDDEKDKHEEFYAEGGLAEFVKWLNRTKEALHKPVYFKRQQATTVVEIALQYNNSYQENIFGFVNTINTVEGGTHVVGFKTALTRVINDYAQKNNLLKNESLQGEDVREGLTAIISLKIPEPQFEGQTKTKLGNSELKGVVDSIVSAAFAEFLEENPTIAKRIAQKAADAAKARAAAKKARDLVRRKNAFSFGGLPGKLADCSSNKMEETELYIVEGDSAGGTAKQARNKEIQAIMPMRGKPLNVEKVAPIRVFSNEGIADLITVIGSGVKETFDLAKLRYGKIIIMSDADVDGEHIKTLLLTLFYRFMPQLIENGHVYAAVPPLYKVRKGSKDNYFYNDDELQKFLKENPNSSVTRFKGLGEMNDEQLWDTTMNPKTRMLKKMTIEDAVEADTVFSMLMGDDVSLRKAFIFENAAEAVLDI
jgi:DNA gyrase subunit B